MYQRTNETQPQRSLPSKFYATRLQSLIIYLKAVLNSITYYLNYFICTCKTCAYSIIILPASSTFLFSFCMCIYTYTYIDIWYVPQVLYVHTCIRISIHIWIYVCACICMRMHGYLRGGRIYVYEFMWWFVGTREIGIHMLLCCECIWIRRKGITCNTFTHTFVHVVCTSF